MARLVILYFMSLRSLQILVLYIMRNYLWETALYYECTFCENQESIWFKFHSFNNILSSEGNGIVGGKLVRPVGLCRVCFWPAARERLPTPDLGSSKSLSLGIPSDQWYFGLGSWISSHLAFCSTKLLSRYMAYQMLCLLCNPLQLCHRQNGYHWYQSVCLIFA